MSRTNGERLAVVETEVKNARQEMQEIKKDIKTVLKKLDEQSNTYILRKEGKAVAGVLSIVTAVLAILEFRG